MHEVLLPSVRINFLLNLHFCKYIYKKKPSVEELYQSG